MLSSNMLSSTLQAFLLVCSYTSSPMQPCLVQPASLPEQPAKETGVLVEGQPTKQTEPTTKGKKNQWVTHLQ